MSQVVPELTEIDYVYLRHLYNMNRINAVNELHRILWNCPMAVRESTLQRFNGEEEQWIESVLSELNRGAVKQSLQEMRTTFGNAA